MATFILVHGAMHGGWCWDKLVAALERKGHIVMAPDLPGSGDNFVAPEDVSLKMTGGFIADLARQQGQPVVLVGHSLGGITISEAAEQAPEAVLGLVYVAAMLLPDGAVAMPNVRSENGASPTANVSEDGSVLHVNMSIAAEKFYNGCEPADIEAALARLKPQATRPMLDFLTLTPARYGSVPRAYVECLQDNAIPLAAQRAMQSGSCAIRFSMDTGHSPFIQAPEELAAHLICAADGFAARV
jgi:pimeloyl-ACP methyl ester carboxylesterase